MIEKITVLGLGGTGVTCSLEINGSPVDPSASNIELSSTEQMHLQDVEGGQGKPKSLMVKVSGLDLAVGKDFAMSWKMGSYVDD